MSMLKEEKAMWRQKQDVQKVKLSDAEINDRYSRGEGRIVVENNREKLHGFVQQLSNERYMDLRPFYQRRPRWDPVRQSRLIESFLINLPVPPVFLYERDYNSYEVMDGQQRITAIKDFYDGKLQLKGLQYWPELDGRYYHNLPKTVKAGIDRRSISSIVMLKESAPEDEEALLLREIVFERLNTGGVALERQEIRNALFQGRLNETIMDLSRHDTIRKAWKLPLYDPEEDEKKDPDLVKSSFYQKMEDAELVLRFFALRNVDHYAKGMQGFLDLYMLKASRLGDYAIDQLEDHFTLVMDTVEKIYGDLAFQPFVPEKNEWLGRPQKAFFDAVTVAISQNIQEADILVQKKDEILQRTKQLFKDHEEGTFTGRGNTKSDIKNRIDIYSRMLADVAA
ncbi:DUF262 domain-containing protein [Pseudosulfitobacter sp. DSM 107133]|uniref:DUF262 domain-containing protein n=1 Tax=Pseudosulfitobacter sp. DSM 107133 TaxID=2883100 RepID=UPI000DF24758|nr:DUF262 domain-containing protein [Pseudosulfitobacter sp. DSM 107133]UOA28236.1 hypothetical protein DSM107133_02981 [Pseudosulfitobacter sp. DSM 107133]